MTGGIWCAALELTGCDGFQELSRPTADQQRARVLVRLHGEPLGYLTVPVTWTAGEVAELAAAELADPIERHLRAEGSRSDRGLLPATDTCPNRVATDTLVSVVVCTRNRSEQLAGCLDQLRLLRYPRLEIVVVDNAPSDAATELAVAAVAATDPRFRYVREPRPGLSRARNRGLAEARGAVVAYTDDDVSVEPDWIHGIVRGFGERADVGCVTGLVCTAGIVSPAEAYFDARAASWSSRCEAQIFDPPGRHRPSALYPYSAGHFGTGANFAFDRALLTGLGGFDEALGAGTRTRGGEDLDIFVRVLRAGRAIAYQPAAIVWHHHRADDAALLNQMYGYGTGLSAFVTKCLVEPGTRWDVLRRIPAGVRKVAGIGSATTERLAGAKAPSGALRREFAGFAAGPYLYARARHAASRPGRLP